MKDQAETLRNIMETRRAAKNREPAIAVYLSPEARKRRLFSPRELAMQTRKMGGGFRIRDESDEICADGGTADIQGRLAVLTGDEGDLFACIQRIKKQAKNEGVKKMDVIV